MPTPHPEENMSTTDSGRKGRGKREKASTPSRNSNNDDMDVDGIKQPPSILKKKTLDGPPDTKKTRMGGTPRGRKPAGTPRERSKSREASTRPKSKDPSNRSKSKEQKPRSKSATPRSKTPTSRAKKTPSKTSTYADKAKSPPSPTKPLKRLKDKKFVTGTLAMSKSSELRKDVYRKLTSMLNTAQLVQGGGTTRILNHEDINEKPLSSGANMPSMHVEVTKYFDFPIRNKDWNGETIPVNRTRKIEFSCLMESDVMIENLVEAVQIDLIDLQIQLSVKTCQALRHVRLLHLTHVYNRFNRKQVETDLQEQLTQFQKDCLKTDPEGFLGTLEHAGRKFPRINVKLDYPFNGPFEKTKDGYDTRFKRAFIIEYALADKEHVETAVKQFKRAGLLNKFWGEHAQMHLAPPKDEDSVGQTELNTWHRICDSHSATMLSTGMVKLDDIKNPDVMVAANYWKPSKKDRPAQMSLRDVLHSIKVSGNNKPHQVFHGMCKAPDGGWEAAVADTSPLAKTMGRNVATHCAGWVLGYITNKGWHKDSIPELMRKSFTTSAVVSAQKATWDKKTGQVTSEDMDEVDKELRNVTDSWVDMSLLQVGRAVVQESAVLESGDMAAFNWEDGASVKTMTPQTDASDNEANIVDSSSDEEGESEMGQEGDEEYEEYPDEEAFEDARNENEDDENGMSVEDGSRVGSEEDFDEEGYWREVTEAEWPIRHLFQDDETSRDIIVKILLSGGVPEHNVEMAGDYQLLLDEKTQLELEVLELYNKNHVGEESPKFEEKKEKAEFRIEELVVEIEEMEEELRKALSELITDRGEENVESAQQKHSVGFAVDTEAAAATSTDMAVEPSASEQDTAQSNAERDSG